MILLNWRPGKVELKPGSDRSTPKRIASRRNLKPSLFLLFLLITAAGIYLSKERKPKEDFYEIKDGEPVLAPWREEKMLRELEEIDDAVQYALVVTVTGEYPCFSCPDGQPSIYLEHGHTWKYGTTRKGETGRYRGQLPDSRLLFVSQFQGTYGDCLKEEKRKIYLYGILLENQERAIPLIRPPGNKNDG
jgi:hypothetical protein